MVTEIAVSVRELSKKYRLFSTPMERLKESLHPLRKRYHKEFWALKNVSFDIPKGAVVGIMGRNGSGKSTLLQIMAAVLRPTSGSVTVNGRVAALLELGAGFNPEFTGRQNVMLNGAIMGLSEHEMAARMPSIIDFADIGEFFDQPMKIYSSGMFVRVAFAASVHLDPDVFIVDEALAVGDAKFQHKCFQRLADLRAQQKTVILVTHNSSLVTSYCDKAYLLDRGEMISSGEPARIVDQYYALLFDRASFWLKNSTEEPARASPNGERNGSRQSVLFDCSVSEDLCHGRTSYNKHEVRVCSGAAQIIDYALESEGEEDATTLCFGAQINLYIKVLFHRKVQAPVLGFAIKTLEGVEIFATNTFLRAEKLDPADAEQISVYKFSFCLRVQPNDYFIDLGVAEADGTRGGSVLDVRRSIAHCVVVLDAERSFDGLVDLSPQFEIVSDYQILKRTEAFGVGSQRRNFNV